MLPQQLKSSRDLASFTLVEVLVALSIFVFAIVGIVGLLLTSILNQHTSIEQTWAVETLREATAAINATTNYTLGTPSPGTTYWFTNGFPGGASNPNLQWSYTPDSYGYGTVTSVDVPTFVVPSPNPKGQVLYARIDEPLSTGQPLGVYLSVAWPSAATWVVGSGWTNAQGFQETYVSVMPPY